MQTQKLYDKLESMGVNAAAIKRANLSDVELLELTKSITSLLNGDKGKPAPNHLIDVS